MALDPTKNVLDLVHAAIQRQDDLRIAERRRVDELAAQRSHYREAMETLRAEHIKEITRINAQATNERSQLLATALQELKKDVYDRVALLEQFRWQTGGEAQGRGAGRSEVFAWIVAGVMALIALSGAITSILSYVRTANEIPVTIQRIPSSPGSPGN